MLRDSFKTELQNAMKLKDSVKVSTLRLILAAVKDRDIETKSKGNAENITDLEIIEILTKMVKQRLETIKIYKKAGRLELAESEESEILVIKEFMPSKLSEKELLNVIDDTIENVKAESLRDLGKVISEIKKNYTGRCDFAEVSQILRNKLEG
tara:strand:+ start:4091 stop:4549 length:459 start_codon:yes stop_codon:yes gene_type:complete